MPIHIVLCDEDAQLARLVSCRLMRADFEVHTAHDHETAWDVIRRVHPQLLITSLQAAGIELISHLRERGETMALPVIGLLSADASHRWMDTLSDELKLSAVLPKPFSLRQFVRLACETTQHAPVLV